MTRTEDMDIMETGMDMNSHFRRKGGKTEPLERAVYSVICSHDGIKAREIAREVKGEKRKINQYLYHSPFMRELCYQDKEYRWHGLIRQDRPHKGLEDFCGYYSTVAEFLSLEEDQWFDRLVAGCKNIGRNLNDTRGLFHSFRDCRQVMKGLFADLDGRINRIGKLPLSFGLTGRNISESLPMCW